MNVASNPYYVGVAKDPINQQMDIDGQGRMYKDQEQYQKANSILPHELEGIIETLGNTFVSLADLQRMLENVKQNETVNSKQVSQLQDKIDRINNLILELPDELNKIAL
jgi:hypothetical protein|tara:strand:- start:1096 stop:1422 length:327 start_codon:yes stop_codon:yes gene_type:complete